jgi:hypothetical protein
MKHLKRMLWVIPLGFVVLGVIGQLLMGIGVIEENKSEKVKPKIEASTTPKPKPTVEKKAEYEWQFVKWTPISPATGKFWFYVENIGNGPGFPECKIKMMDGTYRYHGSDIVWRTKALPEGQIWATSIDMIITNEGSLYVDTYDISCKEK